MKKYFVILLVMIIGASVLMAEAEPGVTYPGSSDNPFSATSVRELGMGGSGIAAASRIDSFFKNPAALAEKRFGMTIPSLSVTLYNLKALLSNPDDVKIITDAIKNKFNIPNSDLIKLAQDMIENLGSGKNELLTTDVNLGFAFGNFGLGVQVQEKIHSLADGAANIANINLIPEINVGASLSLGFRVIDTEVLNLDIGATGQFVYKAYSKAINGSAAISLLQSTQMAEDLKNTLLWGTPVMAGWAVPVHVGVTLGFFNNSLRVSAVASDINSIYYMKSYTSAGDVSNGLKAGLLTAPDGHVANDSTEFKIKNAMGLTLGMAWVPEIPVLNPVLSADIVDMMNLMTGKEKFEWKNLILHLNAGAEINLLKFISLRAGVNRGYVGLGAGLVLPGVGIEASYAWQEFGLEIGDKPVDSFTVRVHLGYDKI